MNQDELLLDPLSDTQFQTRKVTCQRFTQEGQALAKDQAGAKSGSGRDQVTPDVAPEGLRVVFPGLKGFSRANLMYMRAFSEAWPGSAIVQQAVGQLPWSHNLMLSSKLLESLPKELQTNLPSIEQIERELGGQ